MKNSLRFLFLLITILAASSAITLSKGESQGEPTSLRGFTGRFLAHIPNGSGMTCENNPRVCHVEGSPGPNCCHNKCVNLEMDKLNCGRCGKKCSFQKICCDGKCVNPMTDEKHCGKCGNKCDQASPCLYGMCSYA